MKCSLPFTDSSSEILKSPTSWTAKSSAGDCTRVSGRSAAPAKRAIFASPTTSIPTLINTGKQMLSFDTGNGALRREYEQLRNRLSDGQLVSRLAEAGYQPADIDIVVITHG